MLHVQADKANKDDSVRKVFAWILYATKTQKIIIGKLLAEIRETREILRLAEILRPAGREGEIRFNRELPS